MAVPSSTLDPTRAFAQKSGKPENDPVDLSIRQNLVTAFNTVLRTSALAGKIDQQRTSLAFAAFLDNLPDDSNVVPLGPLYDLLLQQKAPEPAAREVIVVLQSREARFNVRFELPPQLRSMSEEERAKIVLMASAVGAPPTPRGAAPAPEVPSAPPAAPTGFVPDKKRKGDAKGQRQGLVVGLVVALVGLGGSLAYDQATRLPAPQQLSLNDASGLPCVEMLAVPSAFLCFVNDAFVAKTPREALKTRADVTRAGAVAKGFAARPVQVLSFEKKELLHVF
jgi:hypothetical protein